MRLPPSFLSILALTSVSLSLCAQDASEVWSILGGQGRQWSDEIWASSSQASEPEAGLLPAEGGVVCLGPGSISLSLDLETPVLKTVQVRTGGVCSLTLAPGAALRFSNLLAGGFSAGGIFKLTIQEDARLEYVGTEEAVCILARSANTRAEVLQENGSVLLPGETALVFTGDPTASAEYTLSAGELRVGGYFNRGKGSAKFVWISGSLSAGSTDMEIENTGTGRFEPGGPGATASTPFKFFGGARYVQGPEAVLAIDVAGKDDFDQIQADQADGGVELAGTLEVRLLSSFKPGEGDRFLILTSRTLAADHLKLGGPDGSRFEIRITTEGGRQTLSLVARR